MSGALMELSVLRLATARAWILVAEAEPPRRWTAGAVARFRPSGSLVHSGMCARARIVDEDARPGKASSWLQLTATKRH